METATTLMRKEILEIPEAAESLLSDGLASIQAAAKDLRSIDPRFVITVARGSSDHASTLVKYACELSLSLPVASIGPSVVSIFAAPLKLADSASIIISQSGKSPDIVKLAQAATEQGSLSIAITNETSSPLAAACNHTIHIKAGLEASVAATKTFVTSALVGPLALVVSFYAFVEKLALERGGNPDKPRNLKKVTETV